MQLNQHQLDAIIEGAIDEGVSVVDSLVVSLIRKAGPIGADLEEPMRVLVEAAVGAGVQYLAHQLRPAVMDIETTEQVSGRLDLRR